MNISRIVILILIAVVTVLVIKINTKTEVVIPQQESTLDAIHARRSVRSYTDQKVTREQVDTILRAAMAAPTAVNKQPWAFIVIDDRSVLDSLAAALPYAKMLEQASVAIIVCGDTSKALLDIDQAYWVQDCSAASQNILLAVQAMGLGAVWTGVFPRAERVATVSSIMNLPANLIPLNVIPIGYPATSESGSKPIDKYRSENIHYNKY